MTTAPLATLLPIDAGQAQVFGVDVTAEPHRVRQLIFLDEPTTGLDPRTRGQVWETIRGLVADGCTIMLTTQYLDEADQLADRIAVIDHGRKVAEGTPDELKTSVGDSALQLKLADGADHDLARQVVRRVVGKEPVATPESGRLTVALEVAARRPRPLRPQATNTAANFW